MRERLSVSAVSQAGEVRPAQGQDLKRQHESS
jgi:hypothetical protein